MPPKDKNASSMKQTTLKGFFAKPAGASSSSPAGAAPQKATSKPTPTPKSNKVATSATTPVSKKMKTGGASSDPDADAMDLETSSVPSSATKVPLSSSQATSASKGAKVGSTSGAAKTSGSTNGKAKPNASSSPIDMDEDEGDDEVHLALPTNNRKRKLVIDDMSDGDDAGAGEENVAQSVTAFADKLAGFKKDNTIKKPVLKKPRATILLSDSEGEADDSKSNARSDAETSSVHLGSARSSTRASSELHDLHLSDDSDSNVPPRPPKKSQAKAKSGGGAAALAAARRKKSKSAKNTDDSDGFVVSDNDDEDDDVEVDLGVEDSEDDAPPRKKASGGGGGKSKSAPSKSASSARPAMQTAGSSTSSAGGNAFLTAAEQRAQAKKDDKKSTESAYSFLKVRKDKNGNLPDDPDFDARTLYIPPSAWKNFTPFEKQFWEIKQNHYDTVLFFQKGKFFELYENDAEIGHTQFDLKLTDRVKMKMVGVPESSFDFWAAKFLGRGYKVGKVEQAETQLGAEMRVAADKKAGAKSNEKEKIVRRELGKILTNGTLVDPNFLQDEQAGHLISIREDADTENTFGLCILDASTGEFNISTFTDDVIGTRLETVIRQLRPKEILYTKGNLSVATTRLLKSLLSDSCIWSPLQKSEGLGYDDTLVALEELYPPPEDEMSDGSFSSAIPEAIRSIIENRVAVVSLGAMIWYLRTLNMDKDILTMKNFCIYDPMHQGRGLILDGQTLSHIEVLRNSEGTEEGSLLRLLSNCITPFGKRLFRLWLCMPLRDVKSINDRLDAVDDMMDNPTFEAKFNKVTKGLPDLERIVSRIHAGSCKPKDFLKVLACFRSLSEGLSGLAATSEKFKSRSILGLLRGAPDLEPYVQNMMNLFEKPDDDADEFVPELGKHDAYDEIQAEIAGIEKELKAELKKLHQQVDDSLVYWHSSIGTKDVYIVEASSGLKVPKSWTKHSGTKNKTKWTVPSIQPLVRQFKEAQETRKAVIKDFKLRVYADFDADRPVWLQAVKVMAELDCLFGLAKASSSMAQPTCRPQFVETDEAFIDFEQLRHPSIALDTFIPNNVKLGGSAERVILLTGPNMGGKSTAMRMTAAGVIMAQLGMYVPAKRATLSPVDAILTRMGAYDNMFSNASTFKVEMDECCKILREATPKSLVILDELGRGTSTYDGMAIAGAVLHQLATHTLPLCCFATHYSSLTDDYAYHPNIRNMHMGTFMNEEERELVFTYKLVEGAAVSSFGTHVASLAGVSSTIVKRAEVISEDFAKQFKEKLEAKRSLSSKLPLVTQADFAYLCKVASGSSGDADNQRLGRVLSVLSASTKSSLATVS